MKDGPGEQPDISRTTKNHIKHMSSHVRDAAEIANPGLASTATQDDAHQQPLRVLLHSRVTDRCQYIDNSVLLLLKDDLIELGSCLENFGLLTLDRDVLCVECPHVIQDEIFDTSEQEAKSQKKKYVLSTHSRNGPSR